MYGTSGRLTFFNKPKLFPRSLRFFWFICMPDKGRVLPDLKCAHQRSTNLHLYSTFMVHPPPPPLHEI